MRNKTKMCWSIQLSIVCINELLIVIGTPLDQQVCKSYILIIIIKHYYFTHGQNIF